MPRSRGSQPRGFSDSFQAPPPPADHNSESPKFCLHYLRDGFDVHALTADRQAAFARCLQKLAASEWKQLMLAPRHGQGFELIPASQLRAPVPRQFEDEGKFMVFRYNGLLPMAGVRMGAVFHVLWIEPEFGRLYDHG